MSGEPATVTVEPVDTTARGRYWRGGAIGGALALVVFLAILLHGQPSLLRSEPLSDFYDVQAHSLLRLRWDVPAAPLGIEGFRIDGKTYEYFGPWPAILRLPVAAVTHRFDGRLTQLSMLAAFVVALIAAARLAWCIRGAAGRSGPVDRFEMIAVGGFTFLVGAGSVLLFLSSRLLVFHEAEIWGVALALAAFEWVIWFARSQRGLHLALACALTTLALLSRVSVGLGPLLALGIVLLASTTAATRRLTGITEQWMTRRNAVRLVVALAIPIALYAYVNYAKFGSLVRVPFERQVVTLVDPLHAEMLAANNNSMIGPQFVPTVLTQYLRPDAIRFSELFPWIKFPPPAQVIGDVTFDRRDVTSSVPVTMPALTMLAIVGAVGMLRRRRPERLELAFLRPGVVGAALALAPALAFGFITQRYLADVVPLLVLAGLAGLQIMLVWSRRTNWRGASRSAWGALAVLTVVSVWWNAGFAILYQREFGYLLTNAEIASFVDAQYSIHDRFPGGSPPDVVAGAELPSPPLARGTLFDLRDCAGLYWSSGGTVWRPLERTNATGLYRLQLDLSNLPESARVPVIALGRPGSSLVITAQRIGENRARLELFTDGSKDHHLVGSSTVIRPGRPSDLRVVLDHDVGEISVSAGGREVLTPPVFADSAILGVANPVDQVTIGRGVAGVPTTEVFPGAIRALPVRAPLCKRVTNR